MCLSVKPGQAAHHDDWISQDRNPEPQLLDSKDLFWTVGFKGPI